jgi:CheY-like chemotaxis protein
MLPQLSHRPRIAVIDDNRTHLQQMRQALERAGYEPRTSPAWELAPLFVARAQPVLVIFLAAPGSERRGWRMLDELKHADETQSIPVLVCSAAAPALDTLGDTLHGYGVQVLPPQPSARPLLGCLGRQLAGQPSAIPTGKSARRVLDCNAAKP